MGGGGEGERRGRGHVPSAQCKFPAAGVMTRPPYEAIKRPSPDTYSKGSCDECSRNESTELIMYVMRLVSLVWAPAMVSIL